MSDTDAVSDDRIIAVVRQSIAEGSRYAHTWYENPPPLAYVDRLVALVGSLTNERDQLRRALGAYATTLRSGERESEQLRALYDTALSAAPSPPTPPKSAPDGAQEVNRP